MDLFNSFIVVLGFHDYLLPFYNFALTGESKRKFLNNGLDVYDIELLISKLGQCVVLLRPRPPYCIVLLNFLLGSLQLGNLIALLNNLVSNLGFITLQLVKL